MLLIFQNVAKVETRFSSAGKFSFFLGLVSQLSTSSSTFSQLTVIVIFAVVVQFLPSFHCFSCFFSVPLFTTKFHFWKIRATSCLFTNWHSNLRLTQYVGLQRKVKSHLLLDRLIITGRPALACFSQCCKAEPFWLRQYYYLQRTDQCFCL